MAKIDLEEGILEEGIHRELGDARKRVIDDQLALFEKMRARGNIDGIKQSAADIKRGNKEISTVSEIKQLDVDSMTPIEALNKLVSIKNKLHD